MSLLSWLKHAKQRIKKGYSYRDVYSVDYWFLEVMPNILEELSNVTRLGVPGHLWTEYREKHPDIDEDQAIAEVCAQWRETIQTIAKHFKEAKEPSEFNQYADLVVFAEDRDEIKDEDFDKWCQREIEIANYQKEELKKGLDMFYEHFYDLWW